MNIAFIGLGQMGTGMARNLLRAGHQLVVHNRSLEKAQALAKEGATIAQSPAEAAGQADVVFTMLADDKAVEDVVFGPNGIIEGLSSTALHASCSTISVALARKLTEAHAARNQGYLSTPVFGRPDAAEAKKLVVVAGGPAERIEAMRPLLEAMGRAVFIAGDQPFQANLFKLCGNFMLMSMVETFGEAFATLRKAGADPAIFFEAITEVFGSPVYKNYGNNILHENFDPAGFALNLGFKDLRFMLEAATELNVAMPVASAVRDQFLSAMAHGQEKLDWSSVALVPARNAGLK